MISDISKATGRELAIHRYQSDPKFHRLVQRIVLEITDGDYSCFDWYQMVGLAGQIAENEFLDRRRRGGYITR